MVKNLQVVVETKDGYIIEYRKFELPKFNILFEEYIKSLANREDISTIKITKWDMLGNRL